jgi:hypothetical protein
MTLLADATTSSPGREVVVASDGAGDDRLRRVTMQRRCMNRASKLLLLLALIPVASSGCATTSHGKAVAADRADAGANDRAWGIEPLGVRLSAAGYMLDFRLRVRESEKAAPLLLRKTDCYLIAEESGGVLQVARSPKIGALRSTVRTESMVKQDGIYATLFANPGRLLKAGDKVTVVMGDFRAEHLVVE